MMMLLPGMNIINIISIQKLTKTQVQVSMYKFSLYINIFFDDTCKIGSCKPPPKYYTSWHPN
jgi:hypothetical protein